MPTRKDFKTIADGVLCSFISRNNDVNGYWGIGKLLNISLMNNQEPLMIDLLNQKMKPEYKEFKLMTVQYSKLFKKICESRDIPKSWVKSSSIQITSFLNEPNIQFGQMAPHRLNCALTIIDDLNKSTIISKNVWCRQHYPPSELKSSRVYDNEF